VPIVLKSESLSLLEPSGPVQGCNGIALPVPYDMPSVGRDFIAGPLQFKGRLRLLTPGSRYSVKSVQLL